STQRQAYPHSLSYQPDTLRSVPSTTFVTLESKMHEWVADEVRRHELLGRVLEDAGHRPVGRRAERRVHLLGGDRRVDDDGQIGERHVGGRHADRDAVDLALE